MNIFPPIPLAHLHYFVMANGMFSLSLTVKKTGTYSRLEFAWGNEGLIIVEPYRNWRMAQIMAQIGEIGIR